MARTPRKKATAFADNNPPPLRKVDFDALIEDVNKAYSLSRDRSVNKVLERMQFKLAELLSTIPE